MGVSAAKIRLESTTGGMTITVNILYLPLINNCKGPKTRRSRDVTGLRTRLDAALASTSGPASGRGGPLINYVKISGLKTTFTFGTTLSAEAKAKFQGQTFKLGDQGASLSTSIVSDNKIELTATGPAYLLAAYSSIGENGLGLGPTSAQPLVLKPAFVQNAVPQK